MTDKNKLHSSTSKRVRGQKADIFFDSIDYGILALTQNAFKKSSQIAEELQLSPKNLHPHLMKLVKIGLLDGVLDSKDNEYAFTTYFKMSGEKNDFGFIKDERTTIQFLNDIFNYIQSEKFDNAMSKLTTSDGMPEIKKK
jgi:hypothetical protein